MAKEDNENLNSQNEDQGEDIDLSDLEISEDESDPEVLKEAAKKAADKAKEIADKNKQLFSRAKKAEGFELKDGKWVKKSPKPPATPPPDDKDQKNTPEVKENLTTQDTVALINAKVHEDDVDEVIEYAKFKKISVADALKTEIIKKTLADKEEKRNTANATNTGKSRPGPTSPSGEKLLEKAQTTGEIPESDKDIESLVDARLKSKTKPR